MKKLTVCAVIIACIFVPILYAQNSGLLARYGRVADFRLPTPYLMSTHITGTGTLSPKSTVGVVGCVVIGVAGAASSTIKLYNGQIIISQNLLATIDATQVGQQFCYGMIFNDSLTIVTASGGTSPDAVVTWR